MSGLTSDLEEISLVLLGSFNPAIFQPAWFARMELMRDEETGEASIEIIRPEIVSFRAGDLSVVVLQNKFQIETTAPEVGTVIRDLVLGSFKILEHTPMSAMGINRNMHFRIKTEAEWHKIGHRLVPEERFDGLLEDAGTLSVSVRGRRIGGKGPTELDGRTFG